MRLLIITTMLFLAATGFAGAQQLTLSEQNMPPEFTAAYNVMKGPLKVGELDVALEQTEPGTWVYHSSTTPFGIAAVFLKNQPIIDRTELQLINNIVRPVTFEHIQKSGSKDRSQRVLFDWSSYTAQADYKDRSNKIILEENTFDNFSLQLLLMANVDTLPEELFVPVISKAKSKQYKLYKVGKQIIETAFGELETVLVERRKDNKKKSTYRFWVDPDNYGLPLQIEKIENGKSEFVASIVKTSFMRTAGVE